jgi:two-component system NtrC family sensor kinase
MSALETNPRNRWQQRLTGNLSAKLVALLVPALAVIFSLLGYVNIRLHRAHLEESALHSAERLSEVIRRSTSDHMLQNDRAGLYRLMTALAGQPGMERIRIFNREGQISFSTEPREVATYVDKRAEMCYGCHAADQPLAHLDRPDRFRIYRSPRGERVLGVIHPIENSPRCSNSGCHAHPASQRILGVLDTNVSLAAMDEQLAAGNRQMLRYTVLGVLALALVSVAFTWSVVHGPLQRLRAATERLAAGHLGHQIRVESHDELGELAASFNAMSQQLAAAREETTQWARTLEQRVEQKTVELRRAHEQVLQTEKMASVGKLAAVVAHEINNPLAGILTYAKLLKKWLGNAAATHQESARREEIRSSLDLIESESRRCGEIVRNLLMFSRAAPIELVRASVNDIVEHCLRLVQHQLTLANIELEKELAGDLPPVCCDAAQIEQVVLALVMNSIEAMPRGGILRLRTRGLPENDAVRLEVQDDGVGIPPEIQAQIFEPFFTTKEGGHGVGLGLAVSRGIIERHGGRIEVASEVGPGTTFTITLPLEPPAASEDSLPAREHAAPAAPGKAR